MCSLVYWGFGMLPEMGMFQKKVVPQIYHPRKHTINPFIGAPKMGTPSFRNPQVFSFDGTSPEATRSQFRRREPGFLPFFEVLRRHLISPLHLPSRGMREGHSFKS